MEIAIRKLTPELAQDYVRFFDETPHDNNIDEHKCYCVCWCSADCEGVDFSSAKKRRQLAIEYVINNNIQGYLAYSGDQIIGWCNANTKAECLKCVSWRRFMGDIPVEGAEPGERIKSIFCFVVAPNAQRKGVATRLLEAVCAGAQLEGFDAVEAYPSAEYVDASSDFMGPLAMYKKQGFAQVHTVIGNKIVMRKALK